MIDFPASPTLGQQFTAAGVTWTWDGTKWTAQGLSVAYLPLTGGTLSGNLTVAPATGIGSISIAPVASTASLVLNRSANNFNSFLDFQSAGSPRWRLYLPTNEAETGGNAGSNFNLSSFGDNNAALPTNLVINRASGAATFGGNIIAPGISAPQAIGDNRIINGDMRIDQRNNGAAGTAVNTYTLDRWMFQATQTAKLQWGRYGGGLVPGGFSYWLGVGVASLYTALATDYFQLVQRIEADMINDFMFGTAQARPVTLSFWANASFAGTFSGSLSNDQGNRCYPFTYILAANVWTFVSVTIPGDTVGSWVLNGNGMGAIVRFDLGSGANFRSVAGVWTANNSIGVTGTASVVSTTSGNLNITGVKLEIGSVATPYNRQSLAKSLADCQRYFSTGTVYFIGTANSGSGLGGSGFFPVTMRANPTVTPTRSGVVNLSNFTSNYLGLNSLYDFGLMTANGQGQYSLTWTASAEL